MLKMVVRQVAAKGGGLNSSCPPRLGFTILRRLRLGFMGIKALFLSDGSTTRNILAIEVSTG